MENTIVKNYLEKNGFIPSNDGSFMLVNENKKIFVYQCKNNEFDVHTYDGIFSYQHYFQSEKDTINYLEISK